MLERQPLRYVLADDPGAGKTIMAGLYIRELMMRADARRVLIVAPGSLVEQWEDELFEKFGLTFNVFSREQVEQSRGGNPFDDFDLVIARLDQLSRNDDLKEKLKLTRWDLVIVDDAHKLSASYYGTKLNKTHRFELREPLGSITRHFLLMTATPHNGKEEDFQLFLSLLDSDRFYGKSRDGAQKVDVSDLMRHMVKEEVEKAGARKLQPYFIRSFCPQAFQQRQGELRPREPGRWEITHVPAVIRELDRQITGRDRRNLNPVLRKSDRVCFEKTFVRLVDRVNSTRAEMLHPGHPLMQSVTDIVLEQHRNKLKQGAVLVDPRDMGLTPHQAPGRHRGWQGYAADAGECPPQHRRTDRAAAVSRARVSPPDCCDSGRANRVGPPIQTLAGASS